MASPIADLRQNYSSSKLTEEKISPDPFAQFAKWWKQAIKAKITEPNAMTLATASADGLPSARIVLLKDIDARGFVFFTNYESFKGEQLESNPRASLVFYWKELERQVRIMGHVNRITEQESDAYFQSRPFDSQVGAVVSPQSKVIVSRQWLRKTYKEQRKILKGKQVTRPANWGGYRVTPVIMEFWQGRPGRLHDRLQYSLQNDGSWKIERLAP